MQRLNKEYKIETNKNFSLKLGTVDRLNPLTFYVKMTSWIIPTIMDDYKNIFESPYANLKREITSIVFKNDLSRHFISDYSLNLDFMKKDNKSFLTIDIVFKQKEDNVKNLKIIKEELKNDLIDCFYKLLETLKENGLTYNNKRK